MECFFWDNIGHEEVCLFLREVLRHLRGNVIALLDNSNTHRGMPLVELQRSFSRLRLEYFPPYAPELNPDEGVWALLKGRLANGRADDLGELAEQLQAEFRAVAASQRHLRGCIHQSGLSFLMPKLGFPEPRNASPTKSNMSLPNNALFQFFWEDNRMGLSARTTRV